MSYGISVWGGSYITYISKIFNINRRAINTFSSNLPLNVPSPLSYSQVYKYQCLVIFHKYLHNPQFIHFHSIIAALRPVHDHSTRFLHDSNLCLPILTKTVTQIQFLFNAVKLWNSLPQNIRVIHSNISFKQQLRSHVRSAII